MQFESGQASFSDLFNSDCDRPVLCDLYGPGTASTGKKAEESAAAGSRCIA